VIRCAVVGASGYSGAELVRLLAGHPGAELVSVHAQSNAGKQFEDLHPRLRHLYQGELQPFRPSQLGGLDAVFLALPHGAAATAAAELRGEVGRVIDLSGDLRLPTPQAYQRWYGREHPIPELLGQAAYGLPELFGCAVPEADLVACAGCYATATQLAAAPAVAMGPRVGASVTASAMSGTSGAGRKGDLPLSFSEMSGDLRAYRVGSHQHAPEMAQGLTRHAERPIEVTFIPHLVPIERGILSTVVLQNVDGIEQEELLATYAAAYAYKPFVRVVDPEDHLPAVRDVVGTNFCDVAPSIDQETGAIIVVSVIDNLLKGAAGQAVQVMNLCLGEDETAGLLPTLQGASS
jgi:N-acetyl-gamma-glutamyl-phosphate reductase